MSARLPLLGSGEAPGPRDGCGGWHPSWLARQGINRHYCNDPDRNFAKPQESYYGDLTFLTDIKQQYDPQDRFHHLQSIRP
ncbi:MAG TPA: BBE domain-containing protein [Luteolibacter sp.]